MGIRTVILQCTRVPANLANAAYTAEPQSPRRLLRTINMWLDPNAQPSQRPSTYRQDSRPSHYPIKSRRMSPTYEQETVKPDNVFEPYSALEHLGRDTLPRVRIIRRNTILSPWWLTAFLRKINAYATSQRPPKTIPTQQSRMASEMMKTKPVLHRVVKSRGSAAEFIDQIFSIEGLVVEIMEHMVVNGRCIARYSKWARLSSYLGILAGPFDLASAGLLK